MPPVASAATGATAHNVINAIISQHLARCYAYFGRAGARRKRAGWVLEFGFGRCAHAAVSGERAQITLPFSPPRAAQGSCYILRLIQAARLHQETMTVAPRLPPQRLPADVRNERSLAAHRAWADALHTF